MQTDKPTHTTPINFWLVISGIVIVNTIGAYLNNPILIAVFKPLISLSLVYYVFMVQRLFSVALYRALLVALLCGLLGDIALMPATKFDHSFLVGLVSFLIGHLAYIYLFIQQRGSWHGNMGKYALVGGLSAFVVWVYSQLFPHIGGLEIPVLIYCLILYALAVIATFSSPRPGYLYRLVGVLIFVISDATLAWGVFIHTSPPLSAFVIATYCLAQIFIVHGVVYGLAHSGSETN